LERAAALTPDPARRAGRTLAAAQAHLEAGGFGKALELLAAAEAGPLDELQSARADLLRGQVAFASGLGSDAPPLLLKAARRAEEGRPCATHLPRVAQAVRPQASPWRPSSPGRRSRSPHRSRAGGCRRA
jgi:hypothetical protein